MVAGLLVNISTVKSADGVIWKTSTLVATQNKMQNNNTDYILYPSMCNQRDRE